MITEKMKWIREPKKYSIKPDRIQSVSSGHFVSIERMDVKTIPVEEERNFRTR